jgi:hypothetical protein
LKKRSKKLLIVGRGDWAGFRARSFLVLFFKKEPLPSMAMPRGQGTLAEAAVAIVWGVQPDAPLLVGYVCGRSARVWCSHC